MEHSHQVLVNAQTHQSHVCYRDGFKPSGPNWENVFSGTLEQCNCFQAGYRLSHLESSITKVEAPKAYFIHRDGHGFCTANSSSATPVKYDNIDSALVLAKQRAIATPGQKFMIVAPIAEVVVTLPEPEVIVY